MARTKPAPPPRPEWLDPLPADRGNPPVVKGRDNGGVYGYPYDSPINIYFQAVELGLTEDFPDGFFHQNGLSRFANYGTFEAAPYDLVPQARILIGLLLTSDRPHAEEIGLRLAALTRRAITVRARKEAARDRAADRRDAARAASRALANA